MPINSFKEMESISIQNKLGVRLDLGVRPPKIISEENKYQLFKDIFFYSTEGFLIEFDEKTQTAIIEAKELTYVDIEAELRKYEEQYPSYNEWSLEKKWFGIMLCYIHYVLKKQDKDYLLSVIESLLYKDDEDVDIHYLASYTNILNTSLSLTAKYYLLPRFSSILDIGADSLYDDIYADNTILFLDYKKEILAILQKHLTSEDIKDYYSSRYYNEWLTIYDELFEDLYSFNESIVLFAINNLNEEDLTDLENILSDDLFASFSASLDIDDKKLNLLIDELSSYIMEVYKKNYLLKNEKLTVFNSIFARLDEEFNQKVKE